MVLVVNTAPGSRGLRHPEQGQPWVLPSTCPLLAPCCCGARDLLPPMLPGLGGPSTNPSWGAAPAAVCGAVGPCLEAARALQLLWNLSPQITATTRREGDANWCKLSSDCNRCPPQPCRAQTPTSPCDHCPSCVPFAPKLPALPSSAVRAALSPAAWAQPAAISSPLCAAAHPRATLTSLFRLSSAAGAGSPGTDGSL